MLSVIDEIYLTVTERIRIIDNLEISWTLGVLHTLDQILSEHQLTWPGAIVGEHFRAACTLTSFLPSSFPSAFSCWSVAPGHRKSTERVQWFGHVAAAITESTIWGTSQMSPPFQIMRAHSLLCHWHTDVVWQLTSLTLIFDLAEVSKKAQLFHWRARFWPCSLPTTRSSSRSHLFPTRIMGTWSITARSWF